MLRWQGTQVYLYLASAARGNHGSIVNSWFCSIHSRPAQMRLSAARPAACAEVLMPVASATAAHSRHSCQPPAQPWLQVVRMFIGSTSTQLFTGDVIDCTAYMPCRQGAGHLRAEQPLKKAWCAGRRRTLHRHVAHLPAICAQASERKHPGSDQRAYDGGTGPHDEHKQKLPCLQKYPSALRTRTCMSAGLARCVAFFSTSRHLSRADSNHSTSCLL
jgi:hypothetical protein